MKLYLLPGLGANHLLFKYQLENLKYVEVLKWIEPKDKESLSEYSKRLAESIDFDEPFCLGGMSFGGQVALEMAKHVNARAVLLVSANRCSSEISALFKMQQKLLETLPDALVRNGLKSFGISMVKKSSKLSESERELLNEMYDDIDFNFFRWSARAVADWDYKFSSEDFKMPIHQVHGENDNIIQINKREDVHYIKQAGHLINYTHFEELNSWIDQCMDKQF